MLNEEKIRLMTRAAAYEAHEGKKTIPINHYFRGDYISVNLIWSWVSYTLAFVLCAGIWAFKNMEYLMSNIHKMDLAAFSEQVITLYVAGLAIYLLITYVYYSWRYMKNRKSLAGYYQILKRISGIYDAEGKTGTGKHTAGGTEEDDDFTGI
ncbi:MAG: hypothetical protein HFI33_10160 [Lachnospiraceae bacterium]|nr:hypothetical protein [Lachnospiraceae bacterium]